MTAVAPTGPTTYQWSLQDPNGVKTSLPSVPNEPSKVKFTATATGKFILLCADGSATPAQRPIEILPAPIATISAPTILKVGGKGYVASVPAVPGCIYHWPATAGVSITPGGEITPQISFDVTTKTNFFSITLV